MRYDKQSAESWYSGVPFTFFVYDTSLIWNGDDRAVAVAAFGRPARTVALGSYRILIWSRPFAVGPVGSEGS